MYYRDGVVYNKYYAACKRLRIFNAIVTESHLTDQVELAAYAVKAVWNNGVDFTTVSNSEIPGIAKTTVQKFYTYIGKSCRLHYSIDSDYLHAMHKFISKNCHKTCPSSNSHIW